MTFNITSIGTSSGGAWQGDNPLQFAFPLLIVQTTLVLAISRILAYLLKPLRQPKVVAEIVGGILLGPSALGRNKEFLQWIFPKWSMPILESVASMGLLFYLFLVGLEIDLNVLRRSGKKAFGIAVAGISLPFIFGVGVTCLLRRALEGANAVGFTQYLMFTCVSLSITAFPVLARILAELKLLTTQVGQTAMAAAAFNDVVAWILLALAVALAGGARNSSLVSIWILLSGIGFVIFMLLVTKPAMQWVVKQCSSGHDVVNEICICLTLAAVMVSGFLTDLIGIHSIFGAFIFGLTIPKDGEFAARLIQRIEDFVAGMLLPLYFASSGLKTNVAKIQGLEAWGLLALVISAACTGKILGTFLVGMLCMIPVRESLTLGLLMNTKGLVELIVLNIGREKKVLDDEMFAILVLMALFTTFMTTPMVIAIYKPVRSISKRIQQGLRQESAMTRKSGGKLRVLACIRGPEDSPSLINLIESSRSNTNSTMKLYIMHLVELTDRSSSILMVQRAQKNGVPCIGCFRKGEPNDQVVTAFEAYSQLSRVIVRPTTSISALTTMHEDICHVAEDKKADIIILPFHKQWNRINNDEQAVEINVGQGWKGVNGMVLRNAPCSVVVFVDRGFGNNTKVDPTEASLVNRVCIAFMGGADSRKSLEIGGRMAEHPGVRVTVIRFIIDSAEQLPSAEICIEKDYNVEPKENQREKELDAASLHEFRNRWEGMVEYVEKATMNIGQELLALGQSKKFELLIVGKGRFSPVMVAALGYYQAEHADLGPAGDILASSGQGIECSALVVQADEDDNPDRNTVHHRNGSAMCLMKF